MSPLLWKKVRPGLSAGRVQSAALRLIVDRELEIESFKPEEYWTIEVLLEGEKGQVKAKYYGLGGKKWELKSRSEVDAVLQEIRDAEFIVVSVKPKERRKNPPLPFTTSTLQQEASRKLGFPVSKTMRVAQTLYEGVELGDGGYAGLITYMRTDSTRVSPVAVKEARQYIQGAFGKEYIGRARSAKSAPGAQDAHEAIRPTAVLRLPDEIKGFLTEDQYKHTLIWTRFVASQMSSAVYDTVTCDMKPTGMCSGYRIAADLPGFTRLYEGAQTPRKNRKGR